MDGQKLEEEYSKQIILLNNMKVHGGEMPQESFFKKISNCLHPTVEEQMAIRITQQGEFADSGNKKKKRSRRKS